MVLLGVVVDEAVVHVLQRGPGLRFGEVIVAQPALYPKMRFNIRLPGLMALNRLMFDAERSIDSLGTVGLEDTAAIADEHFRTAVFPYRRIQDAQEGAQVLAS